MSETNDPEVAEPGKDQHCKQHGRLFRGGRVHQGTARCVPPPPGSRGEAAAAPAGSERKTSGRLVPTRRGPEQQPAQRLDCRLAKNGVERGPGQRRLGRQSPVRPFGADGVLDQRHGTTPGVRPRLHGVHDADQHGQQADHVGHGDVAAQVPWPCRGPETATDSNRLPVIPVSRPRRPATLRAGWHPRWRPPSAHRSPGRARGGVRSGQGVVDGRVHHEAELTV